MERILLIGGAGYLGSILTELLLNTGYRVRVFDSYLYEKQSLSAISRHPNLELITGDLRDINTLSSVVIGVDSTILLAAIVGEPACKRNPKLAIDVNYLGSLMAAYACRYHGIRRFVFASTHSIYGLQQGVIDETSLNDPLSLYAELKVKVENVLLEMVNPDFAPIILRQGTLFGVSPRMRFDLVLNTLVRDAVVKHNMTVFGGDQWRPLVHVADAAQAFLQVLRAGESEVSGQIFNIGADEQNITIGNLAQLVHEEIPESLIVTLPRSELDTRDYRVSHEKAKRILGFGTSHSLRDGIHEVKIAIEAKRFDDCYDAKYRNA